MSCSFHIGYIRHDSPYCGCSIMVVPSDEKYFEYGNKVADEISTFVMERRDVFHFSGLTLEVEEALRTDFSNNHGVVFITDSGDNQTFGADGCNVTLMLG